MNIQTYFRKTILLASVVASLNFTGAMAAPISSALVDEPKAFWRAVMEEFYGPYNKGKKCWTARMGADWVCMRPHRLDQVAIKGVNHLFLVIGGPLLDENGEPQESHAAAGSMGLIILKEDGSTIKLVAKNDLHTTFGTFGALPKEDQFAVREIGPNETYGWVASSGWSGQGHTISSSAVFAPIGDTIVSIGDFPDHYDNMGNCENGKVIGSEVACTDYSSTLLFDSSYNSSRFFPAIMKVAGTREGGLIGQTFNSKFDPNVLHYSKIEGMPEEFQNGI